MSQGRSRPRRCSRHLDGACPTRGLVCKTEETVIHNWRKTEWADGMMDAVPTSFDVEEPMRHQKGELLDVVQSSRMEI